MKFGYGPAAVDDTNLMNILEYANQISINCVAEKITLLYLSYALKEFLSKSAPDQKIHQMWKQST